MEHPERVLAFVVGIIVLALEIGGEGQLWRARRRLAGRSGQRLATVLLFVGAAIGLAQALVVIAFALVLADPDNSLDTRVGLVAAGQVVVAAALLWGARAVDRIP